MQIIPIIIIIIIVRHHLYVGYLQILKRERVSLIKHSLFTVLTKLLLLVVVVVVPNFSLLIFGWEIFANPVMQ